MPNGDVWVMVLLFIIGGILMILELIMPGFGIPGISGIISLIAGVYVGSSILSSAQLTIVLFLVFLAIAIMVIMLYRSAIKNGRISKLLFLHSTAARKEGYSTNKNYKDMLGKLGISVTALRPSGTGEFDGIKLDVITDGQFIPKGAAIRITEAEGFRIQVERVREDTINKH